MPSARIPAPQASAPAPVTQSTEARATATPTIVVGATRGAASRLASTATTETEPCRGTTNGGADDLGRQRHGEHRAEHVESPVPGEPWRQPARDGPPPRLGEEQQTERRHARQGEAVGAGQPRVPHEQHGDRAGQRGDAGLPPRGAEADQPDAPHHGGSDHAGLGPGQHDEGDEDGERHPRPGPPTDPQHAAPAPCRPRGRASRCCRTRPTGGSCRSPASRPSGRAGCDSCPR